MKKFYARIIAMILVCSQLFSINAFAATGYQGYAAYRDGVAGPLFWHAGIMDQPSSTNGLPVTHIVAYGNVKYESWDVFLKGNKFMGIYKPKSNPSSTTRDSYVSMSRRLVSECISYNAAYQVYYDTDAAGQWLYPEDITSMRCDGVIEYIYEYYGDRVYGDNNNWDISENNYTTRGLHSGAAVNPSSQAQYYLTFVSSTAN